MLSYVVHNFHHFFPELYPGQNILKKHRFDMPPGIENNPADMQKITAAVQYAFTQDRSSLKKKVLICLLLRYHPDISHSYLRVSVFPSSTKLASESWSTCRLTNTKIFLRWHKPLSMEPSAASQMLFAAGLLSWCVVCLIPLAPLS
jgi:hypothetical protein